MKRFLRFVCLALVLATLVTIPAYAVEQSERASSFFSSYKAYCHAASSTQLQVYFSVMSVGTMSKLGASKVKVQRSSDGTNWTTVKTFTKEDYPSMIDDNTAFHAATLTCTKTSVYYYRAYVEFYAKNSTGTGELNYYTANI